MFSVLLVDDEPIIASGLRQLINWDELGLEVTACASSAERALALMEQREFDIVLTDVRMPGMSGIDMMREMRARGIKSKLAVISGYDDFTYIKSALRYGIENYIVKPVDETELKETLDMMTVKIESEQERAQTARQSDLTLKDNALCSWAGGTLDPAAVLDRLNFLGIDCGHRFYAAALVRCMDSAMPDSERAFRRECLQDAFESCDDALDVHVALTLDDDMLLATGFDDVASIPRLRAGIQRIMDGWALDTGARWFATIGAPVSEALRLPESYAAALRMMVFSRMFSTANIMYQPEYEFTLKDVCEKLGLDIEQVSHIMSVNAFDFEEALDSCARGLERLRAVSPKIMDWCVSDILFMALGDGISGDSLDRLAALPQLAAPDEKSKLFCDIMRSEYAALSGGRSWQHPLVRQTLDIVESEYMSDLSLKLLSARLGVTQTYLGRLFRKETGALFTDYLTGFRLEKARMLLETTTRKTGDIAREVGFSNPNYFANVFKKKVGVYPTRYRAQLAAKDEG